MTETVIILEGYWQAGEVFLNGEILRPLKSQQILNHSPDGFAWGYSGSGPAQLALAILLEYTLQDKAVQCHQVSRMILSRACHRRISQKLLTSQNIWRNNESIKLEKERRRQGSDRTRKTSSLVSNGGHASGD